MVCLTAHYLPIARHPGLITARSGGRYAASAMKYCGDLQVADVAAVAAATQVPLELAGDRVAGRLGEVGRVLGLFESADVLGHVGVLLGELVDAALPGARLLGQVALGQ